MLYFIISRRGAGDDFCAFQWTIKVTNEEILARVKSLMILEAMVLTKNLSHFGHMTRKKDNVTKYLILGRKESTRRERAHMCCVQEVAGSTVISFAELKWTGR